MEVAKREGIPLNGGKYEIYGLDEEILWDKIQVGLLPCVLHESIHLLTSFPVYERVVEGIYVEAFANSGIT